MKRWPAAIPLLVLLACGARRGPEAPTGDVAESDAGAPSCADLARAQALCAGALSERCRSQENDCESVCDARGGLPVNTEKIPSRRNELDASRCRDDCRIGLDSCRRKLLSQCPQLCE